MTSMALLMVVSQFVFANDLNMIQFLSLSFEGPAKWFFLGIIFYLVLIVAIAVTAIFYIHLEVNLKGKISGVLSALACIHLGWHEYWRTLGNHAYDICGVIGLCCDVCFHRRKNRSTEC